MNIKEIKINECCLCGIREWESKYKFTKVGDKFACVTCLDRAELENRFMEQERCHRCGVWEDETKNGLEEFHTGAGDYFICETCQKEIDLLGPYYEEGEGEGMTDDEIRERMERDK